MSDFQCNKDNKDTERNALLATLSWYRAMGVDTAVGADTVNWLARGDRPPSRITAAARHPANIDTTTRHPGTVPQTLQKSPPVTSFQNTNEAGAREAARSAQTLQALQDVLADFDGCGLKATAKHLCFFRGAEEARVMVIGEAPGRDEDLSGKPFVGRAGQLLDKMLAAINLDESQVHFTNVVYWRPPGNRTPTPQEVLVCRPFLERQIDLVAPEIMITVGGPAAKAILDTTQGIMKSRGKWVTISTSGGANVQVMPTLHPAYLLRTPASKRLAWRDLLSVQEALRGESKSE